jgi:fermentation-respiration switch protein FrsA (DUF1100 family)
MTRAADDALTQVDKGGPIFVIGESLGTGVAAYLAGAHPKDIAGLLLIAPYHNLGDVAQSHFPFLPAKWMLLDKYPSARYLSNYHGPVAVLLAGGDTIVPHRFGQRLFDSYNGPKKHWLMRGATHNDLSDQPAGWWSELMDFWTQNPKHSS